MWGASSPLSACTGSSGTKATRPTSNRWRPCSITIPTASGMGMRRSNRTLMPQRPDDLRMRMERPKALGASRWNPRRWMTSWAAPWRARTKRMPVRVMAKAKAKRARQARTSPRAKSSPRSGRTSRAACRWIWNHTSRSGARVQAT